MNDDKCVSDQFQKHRAAVDDASGVTNFRPGTFGWHELVHTAWMLSGVWTEYVQECNATAYDEEVYVAANEIADKMGDFYQLIAGKE